jgi:hypothetical protein
MASSEGAEGGLIVRQSRGKVALACLGSLAFVVLGVYFIGHAQQVATIRYPPAFVEVTGWLVTVLFGLTLVLWFAALIKPATVSLGPEGLRITSALQTYVRPWSALSNFRIWRYRVSKSVRFDDAIKSSSWLVKLGAGPGGGGRSLPNLLDDKPEQLLSALSAAKRRWG